VGDGFDGCVWKTRGAHYTHVESVIAGCVAHAVVSVFTTVSWHTNVVPLWLIAVEESLVWELLLQPTEFNLAVVSLLNEM